ncbi:MAG: sensor domain-containing phosphodiesterase [Rhodospirillales bacterium]|nr:sensor domain-containing phosphodiesterase [Rhodospirillales bacterium]
MFELDQSWTIRFCAGTAQNLFACAPEALIGKPFLDLIAESDRKRIGLMLDSGKERGRLDDLPFLLENSGPAGRAASMSGYRVPDFENNFFLAIKIDGKVHHTPDETLPTDPETGLAEKEGFANAAARQVQALRHVGGEAQLTLVRVDHLQELAHELGVSDRQQLMKAVGDILKQHSLGGGMAARVDDETFSLVHDTEVDPDALGAQIEKAAETIAPEGTSKVNALTHTLDADGAGMDEEQVARVIIFAIQDFCGAGTNVRADRLSDVLRAMVLDSIENTKLLRHTTASGAFDLAYMPICDPNNNQVHRFEALTRFREDHLQGLTFQIIRLAEETGLIIDFDKAVVEKAIQSIKELNRTRMIPPVSVNLSGRSLDNDAFMDWLDQRLTKEKSLADRILFEITESAPIANLPDVNKRLKKLRGKGFRICLDDFGSGAASFDYLNALDVDVVKFDGHLIRRACASVRGKNMLRTMARMCKNMNVQTVAEMVENAEMAINVADCGVDFGQGWHFGKPSNDPFDFTKRFASRQKMW